MLDGESPDGFTAEQDNILPRSEHTHESKRRWVEAGADDKQDSEDNASPPKRLRPSRVSRACDQCRNKKDKCDGLQPACSTCMALSRICSYKSSRRKRGVPTGYIRTLELLWGIIFSEIKGSENVAQVLLRTRNIPSHLATVSRDGEGTDAYLAAWKNSLVLKDIEKLLDQREGDTSPIQFGEIQNAPLRLGDESCNTESQNNHWQVPDHVGYDQEQTARQRISTVNSSTAPSHRRELTVDEAGSRRANIDRKEQLPAGVLAKSTAAASPMQSPELFSSQSSRPTPLKLPPSAWRLFDIYFTYTQCWFPIIEKHEILRTAFSYNLKDACVAASHPGSGDHAVMWAVLALAAVQDASSEHRGSPDSQAKSDLLISATYFDCAKSLIPLENAGYQIAHAQALLILSLVKFGSQDWASAWILVGHATRIALYLGLGDPVSGESSVQELNSRRKHVFLGCFALETLVANHVGRPPQLLKEHIDEIGPLDEDGLDEWQPWQDLTGFVPRKSSRNSFRQGPLHALSTFKRLISLLSILNDICYYKNLKGTKISNWRFIDKQLERWRAELPEAYRIGQNSTNTVQLAPHILSLHMSYEYTIATLYKCVNNHESIGSTAEKQFKIQSTDHCARIMNLLQIYIDSYSISATSPAFGLYLHLANNTPFQRRDKARLPPSSVPDRKTQYLQTRLDIVWKQGKRLDSGPVYISQISGTKIGHTSEANEDSNPLANPNITGGKVGNSDLLTEFGQAKASYSSRDLDQEAYLRESQLSRSMVLYPTCLPSVATSVPNREPTTSLLLDSKSTSSTQRRAPYLDPTKSSVVSANANLPSTLSTTTNPSSNIEGDFTSLSRPSQSLSQQLNDPSSIYSGPQSGSNRQYDIEQRTNSIDLDTLFDELATFDVAERYLFIFVVLTSVLHICSYI